MIRLVVADDHAIVRAGVRSLLSTVGDMVIMAEAGDGRAAIDQVLRHRPEVLLVDLSMPPPAGVDVIARTRAASPRTGVLVMSMHVAPEYVRPALRLGARGYVVKGSGLDDLVHAIRVVASGGTFFDPILTFLAEDERRDPRDPPDDLEQLTAREREVLQMVAEGHTNRSIGEKLAVSAKTVDVHRTNVMKKLDLHSAQALTRFAIRRGLIGLE